MVGFPAPKACRTSFLPVVSVSRISVAPISRYFGSDPFAGDPVNGHEPATLSTQGARPASAPGLLFGGIWGFLIFAASLPLGGHVEPWDGTPGYYPIALIIGGIIAASRLRTRPFAVWLGLVVGQAAWVLFASESFGRSASRSP
jgi:hypothetical protein